MKDHWLVWSGALSKNWCEDIIHRGLSLDLNPGKVGVDGSAVDDTIRVSTISWLNVKQNKDLVDILMEFVNEANRNNFNFDISFGCNEIQFSEYRSDQLSHYSWHCDTFHSNPAPKDRKLSIGIQLSSPDDYVGGEFEFRGCDPLNKELFRPQGSVLIFPSIFEHRVTAITSGVRYSLVSWIDGPKWR